VCALLSPQVDGNFLLKDALATPYWGSNTGGNGVGPWKLVCQDVGNAVIIDSTGTQTWQTNPPIVQPNPQPGPGGPGEWKGM
jgi:hypothetical protein